MKTCSVSCVKEHKIKFDCRGVRGVPSAPEAAEKNEKYSEELFMKDYNFLEAVNAFAGKTEQLERSSVPAEDGKTKRSVLFKKIQRIAKLKELRLLPGTFTRSKRNRTHLIQNGVKDKEAETETETPEQKSTRLARIAWTVDLVDYSSNRVLETRFDVPDDVEFQNLLNDRVQSAHLRLETRENSENSKEKWQEIPRDRWTKTLAQILVGGRIFEYPQIGIVLRSEERGSESEDFIE